MAATLLAFFVELREPLLTDVFYDSFLRAQAQENELARVVAMRSLLWSMPEGARPRRSVDCGPADARAACG